MASEADNRQSRSQEPQEQCFKEQLDRAAIESRQGSRERQKPNPIIDKITEYIPAAAKILGGPQQQQPAEAAPKPPGPPERPDHDHKIEDFVRDQHRSKNDKGLLVTSGND
ncbi:hypothetical protein HIM_08730 [Hirsutella minnesotensis 3608]|uniref:Uncharacterized protein n=1 Tax=Hirsutella minnesotensis 3608 TaxID=1043627 RepID=A0A0F7ZMB4_9HYPO|nr:hypothetical protein HIM_08730 [Hirsutella minnesotensis 3608]